MYKTISQSMAEPDVGLVFVGRAVVISEAFIEIIQNNIQKLKKI